MVVSENVEEYLEAICRLEEEATPVATSRLAEKMAVSPASASEMVSKLAQQGLVTHESYKGAVLTPEGKRRALALLRRHRLWERLLTDILGLGWDVVHEEACRLEHAASDEVVERIAEVLPRSQTCPHGRPIPTPQGETDTPSVISLVELDVGGKALIQYIADEGEEFLRYLHSLGLTPQATVFLEDKAPFEGPLTIRVEGKRHTLGQRAASLIMVQAL